MLFRTFSRRVLTSVTVLYMTNPSEGGGGATRLKQHLAGRGAEVVHCRNVPPDVRDFFQRDIDRAQKATADRARERLRRDEAEGNYPGDEEDEEAQVQRAMDLSRAEAEFRRGWNREEVHMSVEGVVVRREGILCR